MVQSPRDHDLKLLHRHSTDEHEADRARGAKVHGDCLPYSTALNGEHSPQPVLRVVDPIPHRKVEVFVHFRPARSG